MLLLHANEFYYAYDKKVKVTELKEKRNTIDGTRYFQTSQGKELGVTDEIIVQCRESINCLKLLESLGFTHVSKLSSILFLIKVDKDENVFTVSQKLHEQNDILLAHPNFIKERKRR